MHALSEKINTQSFKASHIKMWELDIASGQKRGQCFLSYGGDEHKDKDKDGKVPRRMGCFLSVDEQGSILSSHSQTYLAHFSLV